MILQKFSFDANVDYELAISFTSLASLGIFVIMFITCAFSKKENIEKLDGNNGAGSIIFIFVGMLSLMASLLYSDDFQKVNYIFSIVLIACSTIILEWGYHEFFEIRTWANETILHSTNEILSKFLGIITLIIIAAELLILIGSALDKIYMNCLLFGFGCCQKAVQIWTYYRLQNHKAKTDRLRGASWYFKLLALVNFILWIESIEVTNDTQTKHMAKILKDGYNIFSKAYTALIIDYRLICCILFIQHAFQLDTKITQNSTAKIEKEAVEVDYIIPYSSSEEKCELFKNETSKLFGRGVIFGFVIIFLQALNAMLYTGYTAVGPWTNSMGILAEWLTVVAGYKLTKKLKKCLHCKEDIIDGIEYLMVMMGLLSVIFWIMKATSVAVWAWKVPRDEVENNIRIYEYLIATAVKDFHRPFTQLFQIFLLVTVNHHSIDYQKTLTEKNASIYFWVPFITLTSLALFLNQVADEYVFYVEELSREANFSTVLQVLYSVGSPIGLSFSLHVFVHFLMLYSELNKYKHVSIQNSESGDMVSVGKGDRGFIQDDSLDADTTSEDHSLLNDS